MDIQEVRLIREQSRVMVEWGNLIEVQAMEINRLRQQLESVMKPPPKELGEAEGLGE